MVLFRRVVGQVSFITSLIFMVSTVTADPNEAIGHLPVCAVSEAFVMSEHNSW